MEDLAVLVARRIRQLQHDGPYHVGGVCAGGLLAYETARQLMNQGQDVALLALFEPQTPLMLGGSPQLSVLSFLARKLTFHLEHMRYLDAEEIVPYIRKRITTLGQRVDRLRWHTSYKLRSKLSKEKVRTLGDILYLAAETYRPQPYSGRAVLFQAITRPAGQEWDEQVRWRPLAFNLHVEEVAGYHDTILVEPHVGTLAARLMTYLPQAATSENKVNRAVGLSSRVL
jgi:thioesterase domain-containing protein